MARLAAARPVTIARLAVVARIGSMLLTGVGATAATVGAAVATATPAAASTILLITPSSIEPGFAITIDATCGDNVNPAVVTSNVFGTITLVPENRRLRTSVTIPRQTVPGTYTATLSCASGQVATNKFSVLNGSQSATPNPNPTIGPATGGGDMSATAGARLAMYGGLGAVGVGLLVWIVSAVRRRSAPHM
jgi:hypothetical protein